MKRHLAATTIALMLATTTGVLCAPLVTGDTAWARAGGGSSGGSRGSRGFSSPSFTHLAQPVDGAGRGAHVPHAAAQWLGRGPDGWARRARRRRPDRQHALRRNGRRVRRRVRPAGDAASRRSRLLRVLVPAAPPRSPARRGGGLGTSFPGGGQNWSPDRSAASWRRSRRRPGRLICRSGLGHIRQMDSGFDPARMASGRLGCLLQGAGRLDGARHGLGPRQPDARDVRHGCRRSART